MFEETCGLPVMLFFDDLAISPDFNRKSFITLIRLDQKYDRHFNKIQDLPYFIF